MKKQNVATLKRALRLRKRAKSKKPDFVRQESWRYDRLKESWRRPKGIDNKMRRKIKGWPPTVNVGYRGPKAARNIHPSGYEEVLVHNVEELKKINPETQAARIAHTVGKKTRALILAEARKRKITILNLGEVKEEAERKKEQAAEKAEESKEEKTEETGKLKVKQRRKAKNKGGENIDES